LDILGIRLGLIEKVNATFGQRVMKWRKKIMYERSKHLLDCNIAGFTYYDGLDVISELQLGTKVCL